MWTRILHEITLNKSNLQQIQLSSVPGRFTKKIWASKRLPSLPTRHANVQRGWRIRGVRHSREVGETLLVFRTNELQKGQELRRCLRMGKSASAKALHSVDVCLVDVQHAPLQIYMMTWGFLKWGYPKSPYVTVGFNTKSWSNNQCLQFFFLRGKKACSCVDIPPPCSCVPSSFISAASAGFSMI